MSAQRGAVVGPPRLAVVWCLQWPVVAAGCRPGAPMAVLDGQRVVARSVAAAAAGVEVGQRRRQAQHRCPALEVVAHDPARDARAFEGVVAAVAASVPRLELTEPGVLTFATRGPARYFGGDEALAARVRQVVAGVIGGGGAGGGVAEPVGVGVADGRFAAGVAAHDAAQAAAQAAGQVAAQAAGQVAGQRGAGGAGGPGWVVVPPGASASYLAPRSLHWLVRVGGTSPELVDLLGRLGVRRLGELAALPAADVLARFGHPGVFARQMAAAGDDRPPGAEDPPPGMAVTHHFDAPVHHLDALVFVGKQLADRLAGALAAHGRVCTQVLVAAETEHGERTERCWSRSTGLSAAAIVERVRWQLDGWGQGGGASDGAPGGEVTAGVIQLRIEPLTVRPDDGVQLGLWGGRTQADEWAQRITARLVGLVGDEQVVVPASQGGRHPAEVHRWVPAATSDLDDPADRLASGDGTWPGAVPAPSPAAVHPEPVPAVVLDADGRPVGVSGRGVATGAPARVQVAGREEEVAAWAGPWVVEERWWDAARQRRVARYQLLTRSGRAYLAELERQRWSVVAEYA